MSDIVEQIIQLQPVLHSAGTVSPAALRAIARHAAMRTVMESAETGSGATTLLLSHLSRRHTTFSLDIGGSLSAVRTSPLLRPGVVTFVEGPSQQTLPNFSFERKLQLAVIDGPHAYPFPELEYYYFYPHLDRGALLVLDDIHIRSIHHLFQFLRRDVMFRLDSVVHNTALFIRTDEPTFDPHGDGWEQQAYNRQTLLRYDWRSRINQLLPRAVRDVVHHRVHRSDLVDIGTPSEREHVGDCGRVAGTACVPKDAFLWVLVHREDVNGWWPQAGGPISLAGNKWQVDVKYGEPEDAGHSFEIAAVVVTAVINERLLQWARTATQHGLYPPIQLPSGAGLLSIAHRTVQRD